MRRAVVVGRGSPVPVAILVGVLAALPGPPASSALPADRAYEMVTPPQKPAEYWSGYSGNAFGVTTNGQHVFFASLLPVIAGGDDFPSTLRADRGATGWVTVPAIPKRPGFGLDDMPPLAFGDQDLSVYVSTSSSFDAADGDTAPDLYRFAPDGSHELMSPTEVAGSTQTAKTFLAAAPEVHGIIFSNSEDPLLPVEIGHPPGADQLYEYRGGLRSVGVGDGGGRVSEGSIALGLGVPYEITTNAYSRDGRRIYFTATSSGAPSDRPGLYLRLDGAHTYPVPEAPPGANADSQYLGATPDGAKAFFASDLPLVPADHDTSTDLYEYVAADRSVKLLSGGSAGADVQIDPVAASDDGSRVYFTARGQLVPGAGTPGADKTFLYDHGRLKLVADAQLMVPPFSYVSDGPQCGPTRATPDGRFLLAQTDAALTAADTDGGAADVYRYDADSGRMTLVSTGPADPGGPDGAFINPLPNMVGFPGCNTAFYHPSRAISDDGRYVFFETQAGLVPQDTNASLDVYVWDAATDSASLISSGTGPFRADFLDATPDGRSVFFKTDARLLPQDRDSAVDVYAARVGGGFPEPPSAAAGCAGSGCQSPPSLPPAFDPPGSDSLRAPAAAGSPTTPRRLRLRRPTAGELRRLLATGRLTVRLRTDASGTVSVTAAVRIGTARAKRVAVARRRAEAGATTRVTLAFGPAGRRLLVRHRLLSLAARGPGGVRARLMVRLPGSGR